MKLKANLDLSAFFRQVRACRGEVRFRSAAGDELNLKSLLSGLVFAAAADQRAFLAGGEMLCSDPEDRGLLRDYTEEA